MLAHVWFRATAGILHRGSKKIFDRFYKVFWQPESLGRAQGRREGVWTHYCKAQWDPQISRFDEKAWFCETMLFHMLL